MESELFALLLPTLLGILMVGLGLELRFKDLVRMIAKPKIVFIALLIQIVFLPFMAFLICITMEFPPAHSIGMMLLAATPSGATSSLFSYVFHGDTRLNISLTTLNSVMAIFTLPFVVNVSLMYFSLDQEVASFSLAQIFLVFMITLVPICFGLLIRRWLPTLADLLSRPLRVFGLLFLIMIFALTFIYEQQRLHSYLQSIGIATALLCFCSLFSGYLIPHLAKVRERQARACAFGIGIHNTSITIIIAISVLGDTQYAIPAAIYTLFMYIFALAFGLILSRHAKRFILGHSAVHK
jgi:bile acid:Na+ symporter, BASS family